MGRRSHEHEFPRAVKQAVKEDQDYKCAMCGASCRGHEYGEPNLEVHHIVPVAFQGPNTRENALGLCDHTGNDCHHRIDRAYFKEQKTVFQVLMEEGRFYDLADHPGNPYRMPSQNESGKHRNQQ